MEFIYQKINRIISKNIIQVRKKAANETRDKRETERERQREKKKGKRRKEKERRKKKTS